MRGEEVLPRIEPELRLEVQGYLPETYVDSEAQRLEIYRRCALLTEPAALRPCVRSSRTVLAPRHRQWNVCCW